MRKILLGLPGLYQNWLMTVLDPKSNFSTVNSNFDWSKSDENVDWVYKIVEYKKDTDFIKKLSDRQIINQYVNEKNFIWYMINFLGKTDEHFLNLDNLMEELELKGIGTAAFGGLYHHFVNSYEISKNSDSNYKNNSLIEFLYLGFTSPHNEQKNIAGLTFDAAINIEYEDFNNPETLKEKLNSIQDLDLSNFDEKYDLLKKKNHRYLNQRNDLTNKIINCSKMADFNIAEQSILGYLIGLITENFDLDWFNEGNRQELYRKNRWKLVTLLNNY